MSRVMQPHKFDLNLLRALDTLLRERSVTRAAERLHITQQAMSGALRRLRETFGDELLIRSGRTMRLTLQAEALVDPVRAAIRQIDEALLTRPGFDPATSHRCFVVAMSDYAMLTILPEVMTTLGKDAPNLVLDVELIGPETVERLDYGDVDLCLLPSDWSLLGEARPRAVRAEPLYEDDFVCVVGADNPAVGAAIDLEQYLAMSHTALRLGGGMRSLVEAAWTSLGTSPYVAATTTSFGAMLFMVSQSSLVATVQRRLADRFARMLPLRILECPLPVERLHANSYWHASRTSDPAHRYLRSVVRAAGDHQYAHKPRL